MTSNLTVVIPTYRNYDQLHQCLYTLTRHTEYPLEIIVVNNDGANQETINSIVEGFQVDFIRIICIAGNKGWMGACNTALRQVDTKYVCFCNDDVVWPPDSKSFWSKLVDHMELHPKVGAVGPCSNFVMGKQNLFDYTTPDLCLTGLLIGFCVVMRTELIKKIGGLDESLPGGDDFDWSIRIRDAGYDLLIDRSAYLHHIGQQTGKRVHSEWDTQRHQEMTDNALIRKHGVRKWWETRFQRPVVSAEVSP